jgi:hypothetical protein
MLEKQYMGDGVYAVIEAGLVKLTVEDGVAVRHTIFLEPKVMNAVVSYYEMAKAHHSGQAAHGDCTCWTGTMMDRTTCPVHPEVEV